MDEMDGSQGHLSANQSRRAFLSQSKQGGHLPVSQSRMAIQRVQEVLVHHVLLLEEAAMGKAVCGSAPLVGGCGVPFLTQPAA